MKRIIKGLNNSQKIRIIIDDVTLNTDIKTTFNVLANAKHRLAISVILTRIAKEKLLGLATSYGEFNYQVNLID